MNGLGVLIMPMTWLGLYGMADVMQKPLTPLKTSEGWIPVLSQSDGSQLSVYFQNLSPLDLKAVKIPGYIDIWKHTQSLF